MKINCNISQEVKIRYNAGQLWNEFLEIPNKRADDIEDFRQAIHTIQRIMSDCIYTKVREELEIQEQPF